MTQALSVEELVGSDPAYVATLTRKYGLRRLRDECATDPWNVARVSPSPAQQKLSETGAGTVFFAGGYRAGKSWAMVLKLLQRAYRWPSVPILVCRFEYNMLYHSTMVSFANALSAIFAPPGVEWKNLDDPELPRDVAVWRAGVRQLKLPGGASIQFQHLKEAQRLGSTEYGTIWIEEASEVPNGYNPEDAADMTPDVYVMLQGRLNRVGMSKKWGLSIPQLYVSNNYAGHNWVWQHAVNSPTRNTLLIEGSAFDIKEKTRDGQLAVPADWYERADGWADAHKKRHLYGSWDQLEGKVFTGFTNENVIDDFFIPREWPCIRSHDPGVIGAAWVWMSVAKDVDRWWHKGHPLPSEECRTCKGRGCKECDERGRVCRIRNGDIITWDVYCPESVDIGDQVKHVLDIDTRAGVNVMFTAIDPKDARQLTGRGLKNSEEQLKDFGLYPVIRSQSEETPFIQKANQGFVDRKYLFTRRCETLIRQIRDEVWDQGSMERGEEKRKNARRSHALAAWKYGVMLEPENLILDEPRIGQKKYKSKGSTGY